MRRVLKPGNLIPSEEVVQIPDVPAPRQTELEEPLIPDEQEGQPLYAEESREISEDKTVGQANDLSRKILQSARMEREKIIKQAQEEAVRIRSEARREAYQQVLENKSAEIERCLDEVDRLLNELQEQHRHFIQQYEDGISSLALGIAGKVLHTAVEEQAELMCPLVKDAVSVVKNAEWISVQVSDQLPDLVELLRSELSDWQGLPPVEIVSAELPADSCVVQTPDGVVDASVSVQLDNLKKAFEDLK